ncbi:ribbon-helix-helix protein, CopG family [Flintibacter faecis]|uniref:Ribbon-helix-helix protein, CopG family n=1 Tax=Flintibacter faecis TaxID=2763047 RepID=A0A8J6J5G4_9FIRM|nr:ribbon-helix-helix protein, CopG family [Flintibacter faecis]
MENKFVVRPRKPAFGKTSVVSARLPDTMIERLDDVAKQTGRTRNELIQMCIDFALENIEILEQ